MSENKIPEVEKIKEVLYSDRPCPVGEYDSKEDGDYMSWLVANNID